MEIELNGVALLSPLKIAVCRFYLPHFSKQPSKSFAAVDLMT